MNAELMDAIYTGATETPAWRGLLQQLCHLCRCQASTFVVRMPRMDRVGVTFSYNADKHYEKRYATQFYNYTPFQGLPLGMPRRLDELWSREELLASAYYRDLLQPAGTEYILGVNLAGAGAEGEPSLLVLSRTPEQDNFGELERTLLEELAPHLSRALTIFMRFQDLSGQRAVLSDALDHLGIGAIMLSRRGNYLSGNATAVQWLQKLGVKHPDRRRIAALFGDQADSFEATLSRCLQAHVERDIQYSEMLALPGSNGQDGLQFLIRPSVESSAIDNDYAPAVCLFLSMPGKLAQPSAEVVRRLFGFSRAESAVVCMLLSGKTAKEIAFEQGVSLSTVRTHIKSIFAKAGVGRQSDLVAAVLRSIALLA